MPKIHNIGPKHFIQYINFPVQWGRKLWVRGWTQEIERPFRTAEPLIFRMPLHKALVVGVWTGKVEDETEALMRATEWRVATDEDFQQEAGWTPAAVKASEESGEYFDT
jgi:hypothetical protein